MVRHPGSGKANTSPDPGTAAAKVSTAGADQATAGSTGEEEPTCLEAVNRQCEGFSNLDTGP